MNEINELRARLDELERAQTAPREMTVEARREIVAALAEHEAEWRRETTTGSKERAELVTERGRLQADTRAKLERLNRRISTIDNEISQASDRFKAMRDPLLRELQAGTAGLVAELVKIVNDEETRISAPLAFDGADPKACADVASRDRRLAALRELREWTERTSWKLDLSEGELRSKFAAALAAVPKIVVTAGPWRGGDLVELALKGGGILSTWTPPFSSRRH